MIFKQTIILPLIILLGTHFAISQSHESSEERNEDTHSFEERSLTIGLALPYSPHLDALGINGRLYYNIGEHICFGPEVTFLKKVDLKVLDINIIGHYIFETPWMGIYPLLGINFTRETEHHHTESAFGLAYGAGMHYNFGMLSLFAEYSRIESHIPDQFITGGLMYTFSKKD